MMGCCCRNDDEENGNVTMKGGFDGAGPNNETI